MNLDHPVLVTSLENNNESVRKKICVLLVLLWVSFAFCTWFLLYNDHYISMPAENSLHTTAAATTKTTAASSANSAFVLVVRNQKMYLTRYTAYVDNKEETETIGNGSPQSKQQTVLRQSKHASPKKESDFSIRKVPE